MRILKHTAVIGIVFAVAGVMPRAASAQVRLAIGIGIGAPVYAGPPPACTYGYYPYAPYACAPYGYYGSEWFVNGVFIGAGPWFRGFYGPAFYGRRNFGFDDPAWIYFHDRGGWRDFRDGGRWRDGRRYNGEEGFQGRGGFRGQDHRSFRGMDSQGRSFRPNQGFHGGNGFRGSRGPLNFHGRGFYGRHGFRGNGGDHGHGNRGHGRGH